jgi:uncharacterized protein (TIGR03437 family)
MKNYLLWLIIAMVFCAGVLQAQPSVSSVTNASSYNADVARGSWFVIFGTGLGPSAIAIASGAPFPTELSGTRVSFTPASGGAAIDCRMWYTSAGQLAALLPSSAAAGAYDVRVTYNNQTGAPRRVQVVDRNFGFATQSQNGQGPAQATYGGADLNRFTTGRVANFTTRPARGGDAMVLWGTGLGADPASDVNGGTSGDQTQAGSVRVIVGGIEVTPAYAGRSSGSPGLDQINFFVPANVQPSCFVSLQVRAGGRLSNFGSIAVASGGAASCTASGLTEAQLSRLDQGGTLTNASINLNKTSLRLSVPGLGSFDQNTESVDASFSRQTVDVVAGGNFVLQQTGACFVIRRLGDQETLLSGSPGQILNAGARLTLSGPNANNIAINRDPSGTYSADLYSSGFGGFGGSGTPTIVQGTYTVAGTGGPDVGPFSASLAVPGNFSWTNQAALPDPIPRSTNLNITWTGGGSGVVAIIGLSGVQAGGTQQNPLYDSAVFVCTAPASAGSFSVPASVLQQLPAAPSAASIGGSNLGLLTVTATSDFNQGRFNAPLTAGGNIDVAYMSYSIGSVKLTGWQ